MDIDTKRAKRQAAVKTIAQAGLAALAELERGQREYAEQVRKMFHEAELFAETGEVPEYVQRFGVIQALAQEHGCTCRGDGTCATCRASVELGEEYLVYGENEGTEGFVSACWLAFNVALGRTSARKGVKQLLTLSPTVCAELAEALGSTSLASGNGRRRRRTSAPCAHEHR